MPLTIRFTNTEYKGMWLNICFLFYQFQIWKIATTWCVLITPTGQLVICVLSYDVELLKVNISELKGKKERNKSTIRCHKIVAPSKFELVNIKVCFCKIV